MKLTELKAKTRQLVIPFESDSLTISYRPAAITLKIAYSDDIAQVLNQVLVGWNLEDDEGRPYPTTVEALKNLPIEFLARVIRAILEDAAPNVMRPEA